MAGPIGSVGQDLGWCNDIRHSRTPGPLPPKVDGAVTDEQVLTTWAGRVGRAVRRGSPESCHLQPTPLPASWMCTSKIAKSSMVSPASPERQCPLLPSVTHSQGPISLSGLVPGERGCAEGCIWLGSLFTGKISRAGIHAGSASGCKLRPSSGQRVSLWQLTLQFPQGEAPEQREWTSS